MSTSDSLVLGLGLPLVVLIGGHASWRVWVRGEDVSAGARWALGETGSPGYQAFMLPGTISAALVWAAVLLTEVGKFNPENLLVIVILVAALGALFGGFWLWLFMWPRFLVPPHLRGQAGWIAAAWRAHRERRRNPYGRAGKRRS